jgi:uncharacterized membrane protein YdjX (TVP38/TMEM64 family)
MNTKYRTPKSKKLQAPEAENISLLAKTPEPIYDNIKDITQKSANPTTETQPAQRAKLRTAAVWLGAIFTGYILWTVIKQNVHEFLIKKIEHFSREESFRSYAFFIGIQLVFSWVLIPGLTYLDIVMASLMKDFYKSFNIIFWGTFVGGLISFFVVKFFLKNFILRKFGDNMIYLIFKQEVKKNPWSISFVANILMIPSCFKNLLLPLTEMTFWQFALPKIPLYILFTSVICLLGDEIHDFESYVNGEHFGGKKTAIQKFNFCLTATFLGLTIWLMVWAGISFNLKIKEFRANSAKKLARDGDGETEDLLN